MFISSSHTTFKPETMSEVSYLVWGDKEVDRCSVMSYFQMKVIWESSSQSMEEEQRGTASMLFDDQFYLPLLHHWVLSSPQSM